MSNEPRFAMEQGVLVQHGRTEHRDAEYDEVAFDVLMRMQREHFWYRGRHKLLRNVLQKEISRNFGNSSQLRAIDLGGGCGGWIEYLRAQKSNVFEKVALADSSMRALTLAESTVGPDVDRYQVDLLKLPWEKEWDVVFLLDVLEHIPDHVTVINQISRVLRPGGLLFVTTPALSRFWSYNDELAHHQRRYCRADYRKISECTGLTLLRTNYFMFFLSPALIVSRLLFRPPLSATPEQRRAHLVQTHRVPARPTNWILTKIFELEASMVNAIQFPWGTSIVAVFRRD